MKNSTIFQDGWRFIAAIIAEAREAAERMKDCDMSDVSKFHEVNQKMIAKIQKETADIKLQKISEKDIVEPDSVVDEENSEEIETRKPVRTRKRK